MFRTKDFFHMNVIDINGKKLGFINDLLIDFHGQVVKGFKVSPNKYFEKDLTILKEDIISFSTHMIVGKKTKEEGLLFSSIKNVDILNQQAVIIGILDDLLIDPVYFKLKGIIMSTGFIKNLMNGKRIFSMNEVILGEENILCYKSCRSFTFKSLPHHILREDKSDEEIL